MKKLLLIRHAKASRAEHLLDDHERPLNERGEQDSFTMARFIADLDIGLDVVFSSTAARALDFAQIISEFCDVSLVPDLSFYTFDEDELMEILRNLPEQASCIAVVAHNPAIYQLANRFSDNQFDKFPTAALAIFAYDGEVWSDINESNCRLLSFKTPKQLV